MHHNEQELFGLWEGWHWHDPGLCAKANLKKWSTSVVTICTRESPEKCAYVRREGTHQDRMGRD